MVVLVVLLAWDVVVCLVLMWAVAWVLVLLLVVCVVVWVVCLVVVSCVLVRVLCLVVVLVVVSSVKPPSHPPPPEWPTSIDGGISGGEGGGVFRWLGESISSKIDQTQKKLGAYSAKEKPAKYEQNYGGGGGV